MFNICFISICRLAPSRALSISTGEFPKQPHHHHDAAERKPHFEQMLVVDQDNQNRNAIDGANIIMFANAEILAKVITSRPVQCLCFLKVFLIDDYLQRGKPSNSAHIIPVCCKETVMNVFRQLKKTRRSLSTEPEIDFPTILRFNF